MKTSPPKLRRRRLTSSQEDYLEAILALIRRQKVARVRDIAERLDVGKSAVTAALKALAKRKLVNYDPYQYITLTERGLLAAERIDDRHVALKRFFAEVLGLDGDDAESNACRVEHSVDDEVLRRLGALEAFLQTQDAKRRPLVEAFGQFLDDHGDP